MRYGTLVKFPRFCMISLYYGTEKCNTFFIFLSRAYPLVVSNTAALSHSANWYFLQWSYFTTYDKKALTWFITIRGYGIWTLYMFSSKYILTIRYSTYNLSLIIYFYSWAYQLSPLQSVMFLARQKNILERQLYFCWPNCF